MFWVDTLYEADTNEGPQGVHLIQVSLYIGVALAL